MSLRSSVLLVAVLGVGLALGYLGSQQLGGSAPSGEASTEKKIAYWVAPMDPNYRRSEPGKSPMGMDLIPVYEGEEPGGEEGQVKVSSAMMSSLGVRTKAVERINMAGMVRTVGYVTYNEDRTSHVHIREPGWIERLVVRSVGAEVRKGDLLFELFSREIAAATYEFVREMQRGSEPGMRGAKAKLKALGMTDGQIRDMERSAQADARIKVLAPQDGVVVDLGVAEGMFVDPSKTVLTLTDLTSVWVIADVFESQADRVKIGMVAEARLPQDPARAWRGRVEFIYPELDPATRTLRVRLRFENKDLTLRPNMFLNVALIGDETKDVLAVPADAVIRDGGVERVIVQVGDGAFQAKAVETGLRAGGQVEIRDGLSEGENVVVTGQFLIDSESNLSGALAKLAPVGEAAKSAATEEKAPIVAEGVILARHDNGAVQVEHGPIPALGWPPMTMDFQLLDGPQSLADSQIGVPVTFEVEKGEGGMFGIRAVKAKGEPEIWAKGIVNTINPGQSLNLTHEPIPALGWPDMTMDFPLKEGVSVDGVTTGKTIRFGLGKGPDGMFRIEAIELDAEGRP